MTSHRYDVLVVGGGPAGAAAGYWLAAAGRDVCVLERKAFPRDKTCGDGLTPRAVHQIAVMGLEEAIATRHHRHDGLRAVAHGITLEMPWPEHPVFPSYGYVVRRRDLDQMVAEHAAAKGAVLRTSTEALAPLMRDGLVTGAGIDEVELERPDGSAFASPVDELGRFRFDSVASGPAGAPISRATSGASGQASSDSRDERQPEIGADRGRDFTHRLRGGRPCLSGSTSFSVR